MGVQSSGIRADLVVHNDVIDTHAEGNEATKRENGPEFHFHLFMQLIAFNVLISIDVN